MKFEGKLSNFFPPDLLIFISGLGKDGVLTVTWEERTLTVSFKEGMICDAQTWDTDSRILKRMRVEKLISESSLNHILTARKEADFPTRYILEKLNLFSREKVRSIYREGILEALFFFFLGKEGQFRFTEIEVGFSDKNLFLNPQAVALEVSRWVDEWSEIEKEIASLNLKIKPAPEDKPVGSWDFKSRVVWNLCRYDKTIAQIFKVSPFPDIQTLKTIISFHKEGKISFIREDFPPIPENRDNNELGIFRDYKKALKLILNSGNLQQKIKALIAFCKNHFRKTLFVSLSGGKVKRCMVFGSKPGGGVKSSTLNSMHGKVLEGSMLQAVLTSGTAFFGKISETNLNHYIPDLPDTCDGAIIPIISPQKSVNLIFALGFEGKKDNGVTPLHYSELLFWQICPEHQSRWQQEEDGNKKKTAGTDEKGSALDLVKLINELPPMPHVASRVLKLISGGKSTGADLAEVLVQDQSLMTSILRVSNSVLYRGAHEVTTIQEAVTRLGFKTLKSIVLTASTRTLFPSGKTQIGVLSYSLWQHAKECAAASRIIALKVGYDEPEEAFIAGILHDIGKLAVLLKLTGRYTEIKKIQETESTDEMEAEQKVLGFTHTGLGALLMKKWRMPESLTMCVKNHHEPSPSGDALTLTDMVYAGNKLAHICGSSSTWDKEKQSKESVKIITRLGISVPEMEELKILMARDLESMDVFD